MEDAVDHLIRRRRYDYLYGSTMEKVLPDIGVGCRSDSEDDDFGLFGDDSEESVSVVGRV